MVLLGNPYTPRPARIERIVEEAPGIKTFTIAFVDAALQGLFKWVPGQFVMVNVFGVGEAPFSIASPPNGGKPFDLTIRAVGKVTKALHAMSEGDVVGVRGPFGHGFPSPTAAFSDKHALIVGGGTGIAPLRALLYELCLEKTKAEASRANAPKTIDLYYGAKTPTDLLYKKEFAELSKSVGIHLTVDKPDASWVGAVGLVTKVLEEHLAQANYDPSACVAAVCGPPVMLKVVTQQLVNYGLREGDIFISIERNMRCGLGVCGHCAIGDKYVCLNGPVFTADVLRHLKD